MAVILAGVVAAPAWGQAEGIEQYSNLDLGVFGANGGNDCWGYVSESGREYALMGVSNKVAVVEITVPTNPVVIGSVSHSNSLWGDVKVYGDYAYVVNESGGGVDIIDLSDVDNGNVTLVRRFTGNGLGSSHNVVIDERSGFLYPVGSNINGGRLVAFDLADPENPVFAGQAGGSYVHDAQVVTFESGPHAGKQIAFDFCGGTGLQIVDVTDKGNMNILSTTTYPGLEYCHQGWLDEENLLLYTDDELDEQRGQTPTTRTMVFDVTDLSDPQLLNTFTSGSTSIDHNLYVHDGFLFEANYTSGLRVFDLSTDPIDPEQVGYFDTYPNGDPQGFDGAWSTYPFFPSGTVIVSDMSRGLFVLDVSGIRGSLQFSYPNGLLEMVDPAGGQQIRVEVNGRGEVSPEPGTGVFHYDLGDGFVSEPMDELEPNVYEATIPPVDCFNQLAYYFSAESTEGEEYTDPSSAPAGSYAAVSATGVIIALEDDFETDNGWTAVNLGATSGDWQRGVPVDDPRWDYGPTEDGDGSGQAWLTENENNPNYDDPWNTDVDSGAVELTSQVFDMSSGGDIRYLFYLNLTRPQDNNDVLLVEINSEGGDGAWTQIARHNQNQGRNWTEHVITQTELADMGVAFTTQMQLRYTANDAEQQSIVEAGVDGLRISSLVCEVGGCERDPAWQCDGDVDGDGQVNPVDSGLVQAAFGSGDEQDLCNYDLDCDGQINPVDSGIVQSLFGTCAPVREVCP